MKALSVIEPMGYCMFHLVGLIGGLAMPQATEHRGPLVICTHSVASAEYNQRTYLGWRSGLAWDHQNKLPVRWEHFRVCLRPGMALGLVDLVECIPHSSVTWHWHFENARSFDRPFVWKAQLGLHDVDDALVADAQPRERVES